MSDEDFADSTAAAICTWRFSQLCSHGYGSQAAELLALSDADLHKVCDAKDEGCSDDQALAIFL